MTNLEKRIDKLESEGWALERNYNTGAHSLELALVKRWVEDGIGGYKTLIKKVINGKIKDYRK